MILRLSRNDVTAFREAVHIALACVEGEPGRFATVKSKRYLRLLDMLRAGGK